MPVRTTTPGPHGRQPRLVRATRWHRAPVFIIAGALALSACSKTSSDTAPAAAANVDPQAVQTAKADVAKYSAKQPDVSVKPLPGKPASGKTIGIVTCQFPTCLAVTRAAEDAAQKLGWKAQEYTTEITPEAFQNAFTRMLQSPPDVILYAGVLPNSLITESLAKIKQLNIPTVALATTDPPNDTVRAVISGPPTLSLSGKLMGDGVVADANGAAKTVFVWDPNSARVFQPVKDAFEKQVKAGGGSVEVLQVSTPETGKAIPGQVVSYLQAHPDVKYVAFDTADFIAGVPPALAGAGLSDVKLVSRYPVKDNIENLKNGSEWLEVGEEGSGSGYRCIDALVRVLAGIDPETSPEGWHQILTKDNVGDISGDPAPPGVPQAYLDAWHLGS